MKNIQSKTHGINNIKLDVTPINKIGIFLVRPAWAQSYGLKSLVCPSSGKDIANGKGVASDCESEGSRMANLWSDEQKSHQATAKDKTAKQVEVQ